jgi:hypothetical protein
VLTSQLYWEEGRETGRKPLEGSRGKREADSPRTGSAGGATEGWNLYAALYPEASIASGTFCAGQKIIGVNLEHRPAVSGFPAACALRDRARRQRAGEGCSGRPGRGRVGEAGLLERDCERALCTKWAYNVISNDCVRITLKGRH